MENLDDIKAIKDIDKDLMYKTLLDFPEQCRRAVDIAKQFEIPTECFNVDKIVIAGMGGSAIGGDLLRSIFIDECPIPIVINRNYSVPKFVDDNTLFIGISYSGNTEETIEALKRALDLKAKAVSISSGGKLQSIAQVSGVPHLLIPEKGLQPRCAFGYLFLPLIVIMSRAGFVPNQSSEIDEAIQLISETKEKISPYVGTEENEAKKLAQILYNHLPIIYGSQNHLDVVAMRWKGQFNENSKMMAFYNVIPEMNHNEIVGWGIPNDITQRCVVLMLEYDEDSERISKRIDITDDLIRQTGARVIRIKAKGGSKLSRALYLIYLGDFVSYYLALLNDVDPSPVERISILKQKLEKDT